MHNNNERQSHENTTSKHGSIKTGRKAVKRLKHHRKPDEGDEEEANRDDRTLFSDLTHADGKKSREEDKLTSNKLIELSSKQQKDKDSDLERSTQQTQIGRAHV